MIWEWLSFSHHGLSTLTWVFKIVQVKASFMGFGCQEKIPPEKSPLYGVRGRVRIRLGRGAFFRGYFFLEPFQESGYFIFTNGFLGYNTTSSVTFASGSKKTSQNFSCHVVILICNNQLNLLGIAHLLLQTLLDL